MVALPSALAVKCASDSAVKPVDRAIQQQTTKEPRHKKDDAGVVSTVVTVVGAARLVKSGINTSDVLELVVDVGDMC